MRLYARPSPLLRRQLTFDALVVIWLVLWWKLSAQLSAKITALATPADRASDTLATITRGLGSIGEAAARIPLVGGEIQRPVATLAGDVAHLMASTQAQAEETRQTATEVGWWVFALASLLAVSWWAWHKYRYARATAQLTSLLTRPGGTKLLAFRALAHQPLRQLASYPHIVDELMRGEQQAVVWLANLELRRLAMAELPGGQQPVRCE
ncbi:MAG: hypothetical protein Q4Q03_00550 [Bowdeniella nasicola]|nr:hypothetical protein [Bowdeniella nasicola]